MIKIFEYGAELVSVGCKIVCEIDPSIAASEPDRFQASVVYNKSHRQVRPNKYDTIEQLLESIVWDVLWEMGMQKDLPQDLRELLYLVEQKDNIKLTLL